MVGKAVLLMAALTVPAMMLFATLNLALRLPSRARVAEEFKRTGRGARLERLVTRRSQYVLATATLRAVATLCLFWEVLYYVELNSAAPPALQATVIIATSLLLVLVFAVAIPHAWAKYAGERLLAGTLPLLEGLRVVCYPVLAVLQLFDPLVRRLAGVPVLDAEASADELEKEILDTVREMERQGAVDEDEKEMIESVIDLRDTLVQEVMTPRTEVVAIAKEADLRAVRELIRTTGHSRIPVYDGTIDSIVGVLYAKDLLHLESTDGFQATAVMRKVSFIPETKPVRDLLREFQQQKVHIAVVLDEYGGTAGLVSIEDILEELVGEIADEYEEPEPEPMLRIDEQTVEVDARMRVDELNYELDLTLPEDEDYETIGGFVFSTLGRIPEVGEECRHDNVSIHVIGAEARRITRLRLHITPAAAENANER
ncbi:MAG TPA: hemolysin family protein [Phycisphaerae bacterium]|nr:hemolysin family protein [Phycisphaerae bacterium]HNU46137.1 hemolysin family protein [Phycisphaerae bacterium]